MNTEPNNTQHPPPQSELPAQPQGDDTARPQENTAQRQDNTAQRHENTAQPQGSGAGQPQQPAGGTRSDGAESSAERSEDQLDDSASQGQPQGSDPSNADAQGAHASASSDDVSGGDDSADDDSADDDTDSDDDEAFVGHAEPIEEDVEQTAIEDLTFDWYILKVQVNREDSICDALMRRVARAGLEEYFHEIIVPTEDVVEFTKSGKKRTVKKKLYPGYIMVNMALTEDTWFLVRETPGIGDFTGSAGKPTPMDPDEVRRIIKTKVSGEESVEEVRIAIPFHVGDRVRVTEGHFQNFEGDVDSIDSANGRVTVMINIFGRSTPVELRHWQMERV